MMLQYQANTKNPGNMIVTDSTHTHSGAEGSLANKRLKSYSLGTVNKKTLNMSHQYPGIGMIGIERDQSTLNDGQFLTLAKTGLLNNLNLS